MINNLKKHSVLFLFLVLFVLVCLFVRSHYLNKIYNHIDNTINIKHADTFLTEKNTDLSISSNYYIELEKGSQLQTGLVFMNGTLEDYEIEFELFNDYLYIDGDDEITKDITPSIEFLDSDLVVSPNDRELLNFVVNVPEEIDSGRYEVSYRFILPFQGQISDSSLTQRFAQALKFVIDVKEKGQLTSTFINIYDDFNFFLVRYVVYPYLPIIFASISILSLIIYMIFSKNK